MTAARATARGTARATARATAPNSRPVRLEPVAPRRTWPARMRLAAAGAVVFVLVGVAVALQAQQVYGQDHLDSLRTRLVVAGNRQADLREAVARAESPQRVLEAARSLGMIDPAAVAPVPAPPPTTAAPTG